MAADAAESLKSCLFEMAEAETNPVLQVIASDLPLIENKKYPADLLQFDQMGWQAYYHCHPALRAGNHRFQGEHGHFHVFIRTQKKPDEWAHLIALAIDNMGQPLGWFTVNHWVTGEKWESAKVLTQHLDSIPFEVQNNVVERWLLSLLALDKNSVKTILDERDHFLLNKIAEKDIKQDKNFYLLSETPINLKALLNISEEE